MKFKIYQKNVKKQRKYKNQFQLWLEIEHFEYSPSLYNMLKSKSLNLDRNIQKTTSIIEQFVCGNNKNPFRITDFN